MLRDRRPAWMRAKAVRSAGVDQCMAQVKAWRPVVTGLAACCKRNKLLLTLGLHRFVQTGRLAGRWGWRTARAVRNVAVSRVSSFWCLDHH